MIRYFLDNGLRSLLLDTKAKLLDDKAKEMGILDEGKGEGEELVKKIL